MTSYREELGYLPTPTQKPRPRPLAARVEGVRHLGGAEGWEGEILRPCGRRAWVYGSTKDEAMTAARRYAAEVNRR